LKNNFQKSTREREPSKDQSDDSLRGSS